jgi:prepilin peptidase CpaA
MGFWTLNLPFQFIYVLCVAYAVFSDIRHLTIPNWVSATLVMAFLLYCVMMWPEIDLAPRFMTTAFIFMLSFFFYQFNWFGGGDVKFLTAVSLWVGPLHVAAFAMLMALLGSLLALLLIKLRRLTNAYGAALENRVPTIVRRWMEEGICPYGVAIGVAALGVAPQVFQ